MTLAEGTSTPSRATPARVGDPGGCPRDQYIVTTSEFDAVKARMMALHNGHKIQEQQDQNKPTLRHAPGTTSPDGKDDDRPVLKKRE